MLGWMQPLYGISLQRKGSLILYCLLPLHTECGLRVPFTIPQSYWSVTYAYMVWQHKPGNLKGPSISWLIAGQNIAIMYSHVSFPSENTGCTAAIQRTSLYNNERGESIHFREVVELTIRLEWKNTVNLHHLILWVASTNPASLFPFTVSVNIEFLHIPDSECWLLCSPRWVWSFSYLFL